jgi:hypothetical protein
MATVQTQHVREERWRETTRMMVLQKKRLADWKITEMKHMRFKTTQKQQKYNIKMNKYPQVGKTGVDAVHGSCPQMV